MEQDDELENKKSKLEIISIVGQKDYFDPIKGFTTLYRVKSRKQLKSANDQSDDDDDEESDQEIESWLHQDDIVGENENVKSERNANVQDNYNGKDLGDSSSSKNVAGTSTRSGEEVTAFEPDTRKMLASEPEPEDQASYVTSTRKAPNTALDLLEAYDEEKQAIETSERQISDEVSQSSLSNVSAGGLNHIKESDRAEIIGIVGHRDYYDPIKGFTTLYKVKSRKQLKRGNDDDDEEYESWFHREELEGNKDEYISKDTTGLRPASTRELVFSEREYTDQLTRSMSFDQLKFDKGSGREGDVVFDLLRTYDEEKQVNATLARQFLDEIKTSSKNVLISSEELNDPGGAEIIGIIGHRDYYDPIKGFTTLYKVKSRKQMKSGNDDDDNEENESWLHREELVDEIEDDDDEYEDNVGFLDDVTDRLQSSSTRGQIFSKRKSESHVARSFNQSRSAKSGKRKSSVLSDLLRAYDEEKQVVSTFERQYSVGHAKSSSKTFTNFVELKDSGGMPSSSVNQSLYSSIGGHDDDVGDGDEGDRVETIIKHRNLGSVGDDEYLVRWMGCSAADDEWVPRVDLIVHERILVQAYERSQPELAKIYESAGMKRAMSFVLEGAVPKNRLNRLRKDVATKLTLAIIESSKRQHVSRECKVVHKLVSASLASSIVTDATSKSVEIVCKLRLRIKAAIDIQTCARQFFARIVVKRRFAARRIVCCFRMYMLMLRCTDRASTRVYSQFRLRKVAAMCIQSPWRVAIARRFRKRLGLRKKAVVRIQCVWRVAIAWRVTAKRRSAVGCGVVLIQSIIRGFLSRKLLNKVRTRIFPASCLIQCTWRGYIARRRIWHKLRAHRLGLLIKESRRLHKTEHRIFVLYCSPEKKREAKMLGLVNVKPYRRNELPPLTSARKKELIASVSREIRAKEIKKMMSKTYQHGEQLPPIVNAPKNDQQANPSVPTITYVERKWMFGSIAKEYDARYGDRRRSPAVDVQKRAADAKRNFERLPNVGMKMPKGSFEAPMQFTQHRPLIPALWPPGHAHGRKCKKKRKIKTKKNSRHEHEDVQRFPVLLL